MKQDDDKNESLEQMQKKLASCIHDSKNTWLLGSAIPRAASIISCAHIIAMSSVHERAATKVADAGKASAKEVADAAKASAKEVADAAKVSAKVSASLDLQHWLPQWWLLVAGRPHLLLIVAGRPH
ncbi:hypothetical protein ACA910_006161 [Epithemia clementina (nom. ined.)]